MKDDNLLTKKKENIKNETILERFCHKKKDTDIVAQFITEVPHDKNNYEFRFYTKSNFKQFLNDCFINTYNGIIQMFVEPSGDYNSIIRVSWSENIVMMESAYSKCRFKDEKFSIYERCATFPGDDKYSYSYPVRGNIVPTAIEKTTRQIFQHIASATKNSAIIQRATVYYKVSSDNTLMTLFLSSIKCKRDNPN